MDSIVPELKGRTKKQVLEELIDAVKHHKPARLIETGS